MSISGFRNPLAKSHQDIIRILPFILLISHQNAMSGKGICVGLIHVGNNARAEWIEMDVAHQFEQVGIFLTQYGVVPVLKKMAGSVVSPVMGYRITGQKPSHQSRNRYDSGSDQQVKVVVQQCPCQAPDSRVCQKGSQAVQKIPSVIIIQEYLLAVDPLPIA